MDKKIKVLYLHHIGAAGGSSNSLYYLLSALPNNVEKHIITPSGDVIEKFKKITPFVYELKNGKSPFGFSSVEGVNNIIPRILFKLINDYDSFRQVKELIDVISPDIIHLNDNNLIFFAKIAKKKGYPVIMHARIAMSKKDKLVNRISEYYINKYVDKVLAITGSVKGQFKKVKSIDIIYNTYPSDSNTLNKFIERKSKEFYCLFLANLYPFKGIYETIEAARILQKEHPHIKFLVAGANVQPDEFFTTLQGKILSRLGVYRNVKKDLELKIKEYKLENFELLGYVNGIKELFKKSHLLLTPVLLNAPPRNVFEAGMHGIPCVISYKDKIEDVVKDDYNGIIINEKDPKALANAILTLDKDENYRKLLGENAINYYSKINRPEIQSKKVFEIYKNILLDKGVENK